MALPQPGSVLLLKKENTDEDTVCTSLGPQAPSPLWKGSHSSYLESCEIWAKQSVTSLGYFPVAVCGMSLQFSVAYNKNCWLQRFVFSLVRHISARAGQHQSEHCGKAGAGHCHQPRKYSDFTNRRKQSSPGPLTGLYLYHLSSILPRRKSLGLCYFLKPHLLCGRGQDGEGKQAPSCTAQTTAGQCLRLSVLRHCSAHWAQTQH